MNKKLCLGGQTHCVGLQISWVHAAIQKMYVAAEHKGKGFIYTFIWCCVQHVCMNINLIFVCVHCSLPNKEQPKKQYSYECQHQYTLPLFIFFIHSANISVKRKVFLIIRQARKTRTIPAQRQENSSWSSNNLSQCKIPSGLRTTSTHRLTKVH